jgi:hypothetical protein
MEELQAAVIIAIAACPDVRFVAVSETAMRFTFERPEGVELFIRGLEYYSRLRAAVIDARSSCHLLRLIQRLAIPLSNTRKGIDIGIGFLGLWNFQVMVVPSSSTFIPFCLQSA